ncbi:MAG: hypothetical protein ABR867_04095 [Nitrososphaerales archaeon]|jgi:hypothetical protein
MKGVRVVGEGQGSNSKTKGAVGEGREEATFGFAGGAAECVSEKGPSTQREVIEALKTMSSDAVGKALARAYKKGTLYRAVTEEESRPVWLYYATSQTDGLSTLPRRVYVPIKELDCTIMKAVEKAIVESAGTLEITLELIAARIGFPPSKVEKEFYECVSRLKLGTTQDGKHFFPPSKV